MKITVKVLGGAAELFFDVDPQIDVKKIKELVSQKMETSPDQVKLVYKGRTLSDDKFLSDYKVIENTKLHAVLKKQPKQEEIVPKQPKYKPDEFWRKLEEILNAQYNPNNVFDILSQFKKDYDNMLTTMSLDDIERIAKRKLAD